LTPVFTLQGCLCEGKINGDAVNRKECHYGGYHFRDRGKPEVFAAGAKPEKRLGKPTIPFNSLWRNGAGISLEAGLKAPWGCANAD
jgi:hypothetical protein